MQSNLLDGTSNADDDDIDAALNNLQVSSIKSCTEDGVTDAALNNLRTSAIRGSTDDDVSTALDNLDALINDEQASAGAFPIAFNGQHFCDLLILVLLPISRSGLFSLTVCP